MESTDPFWTIRENKNTGLENQKAAVDMLDAVEKTMQERNLDLNAENYFKSLWPLLDKAEKIAGLEVSVIYLCHFVFPHLSVDFVKANYSELYGRLPGLIKDGMGNAPFLRSALSCMKVVLMAFDKEDWTNMTSLSELVSLVLGLCLDERPKVRKCAQECVVSMLSKDENATSTHLSLSLVAQFFKLILQGTTRKDSSKALHIVPLVKKLVPFLDQTAIDGLIGPMLQCCGLGSGHLTVAYFGAFQELCKVCEDTDNGLIQLPRLVQLNLGECKKILEGLVRLKPATFELADISAAWIGAFGYCLAHPSLQGRLEITALNGHLLSLFEGLNSSNQQVLLASQIAFSILPSGISSDFLPGLFKEALQKMKSDSATSFPYLLAIIRDQIMLKTGASMDSMCSLLSSPYAGILEMIAECHDQKGYSEYRSDCVKAVHDFIRVFGPEEVLNVIPLNLEPTRAQASGPSRAWILPIMKEAVYNASLGFFNREMVPLADRLAKKAEQFKAEGKLGDGKVYETVVFQIWSLVPSFLRYPVDFESSFGTLAPRLAALMNDEPILRPIIVNSVTGFIERCRNYENDMESGGLVIPLLKPIGMSSMERQIGVIKSMANNFLPLLFNLLGVTKTDQRIYLLSCIKGFLEVSDESVVRDCFGKISSHLGSTTEPEQQVCLLELLCTMIQFLDESAYRTLCQMSLPVLVQSEDAGLQKAVYKALHLVISHEMFGPQIFADLFVPFEEALNAGSALIEVSAVRKCRFRLLLGLLPMLPDDGLHWIPVFLPEVILGTKEINQKTRLLAFELLLAFARRMSRGGTIRAAMAGGMLPSDTAASLDEYMTMVLAGLAGKTPHMISATVISLARLLFDLASSIPSSTIQAILSDILLLFGSPSREIVKSAFGYVKVAVVVLPSEELAPHLGSLVESILAWSDEHAMHFKVRVRHLMERLIRKFGYEVIFNVVPEDHRRLITNIKKRKDRAKRQKDASSTSNDAEEEMDEDDQTMDMDRLTSAAFSKQTSMMTRRGISSTATATRPSAKFEAALYDSESDIEPSSEDEDDNAMITNETNDDDLETALSRKLSLRSRAQTAKTAKTAKSALKKPTSLASKKSADFKLNPEGKMIIEDSDAEVEDDDGIVIDENAHRLYEQSLKTFSRPGKHVKFSQKRSREDEEDEEDYTSYAPSVNKTTISRLSKVSRPAAAPRVAHSGQEFKAKRGAGGDVKSKKSKVEPYAYVPLQRATAKGQKSKNTYFLQKKKQSK